MQNVINAFERGFLTIILAENMPEVWNLEPSPQENFYSAITFSSESLIPKYMGASVGAKPGP